MPADYYPFGTFEKYVPDPVYVTVDPKEDDHAFRMMPTPETRKQINWCKENLTGKFSGRVDGKRWKFELIEDATLFVLAHDLY